MEVMNVATDSIDLGHNLETRVEVMMVYADPLTRSRVMRIYQRLHQQLWQEFEFNATWWKFDYLAHPQIAAAATESLNTADLVFFAIKAGTELPVVVKEWLQRWPPRSPRRGKSLLALLEVAGGAIPMHSPARQVLRTVALRAHMDYLPYYAGDEGELGEQHSAALEQPAPLDVSLQRFAIRPNPASRWGLNE